ncbi:hypothetical protein [Fructilactobacillus fructivorans]|uniref:hypothetical protein n=1 Tax=Fructilactobacillus fructivorans TaxID=1614 RepID=UPI0002196E56|nr:hypothetical protein [Fructilactobacillus fructivorans]KRK58248.1 hypothetical protein FC73_GL000631 [Fructilactobacillus fructivorans]KRN40874.1 hypothetical protein IV51_GL001101 [Fructilactobacillus fructivorans]KRN42469.1 hypothetical protein IV48_GL000232 [Fructilactobacillus fructivorans]
MSDRRPSEKQEKNLLHKLEKDDHKKDRGHENRSTKGKEIHKHIERSDRPEEPNKDRK